LALASVSGLAMLVMPPSTDRARASGVVEPVADAYVTAHHPRTRHGADPTLRMRGTPVTTSYLRFDLTDEDAQVTGATLRLYARTSSPGVRVRAVGDDAWSEQAIDAKTAPPLGQVVARSARLKRRHWIEVDVTPLVRAGEEVSIGLTAHGRTPRVVAAREAARTPELVIENGPEPATGTAPEPATEAGPIVRTDPPILVSATGATLAGSLDSKGGSATYWFEYGPTPAYGSETPSRGAAPLSASQPVSEGIAGLSPATTYHYRLVAAGESGEGAGADGSFTTAAPRPPGAPPSIAAAGDIACDPGAPDYNGGAGTLSTCRHKYTSDLLVGGGFDAVLTLGDNQYPSGTLAQYLGSYDPTWGRVKQVTFPIPGNHEYADPGASGYFDYFNGAGNTTGRAGTRGHGYYSYGIGEWHVIALNSNCSKVGGCGQGSPEEQWLRGDLAAHPASCTLAYWHHPRFNSGAQHGNDPAMGAFWKALYDADAELVLNGHEHVYERFAPQDPSANADPGVGIRQFTVGTGGHSHDGPGAIQANSQVLDYSSFGVLTLELGPTSYEWRFVPEVGSTFTDSGAGVCH
jgi:calcineurin-like phosphoesterase family protein